MSTDDDFAVMAVELKRALLDGLDVNGAVEAAEIHSAVGKTSVDYLVEVSSGDAETQRIGIVALCDLLNTRLLEGSDQVMGCLLIDGEADPGAVASALPNMNRNDGTFTPILPLSSEQARLLAESGVSLFDLVDDATALIEIAASRPHPDRSTSQTLLEELDELIERRSRDRP